MTCKNPKQAPSKEGSLLIICLPVSLGDGALPWGGYFNRKWSRRTEEAITTKHCPNFASHDDFSLRSRVFVRLPLSREEAAAPGAEHDESSRSAPASCPPPAAVAASFVVAVFVASWCAGKRRGVAAKVGEQAAFFFRPGGSRPCPPPAVAPHPSLQLPLWDHPQGWNSG